VTAPTITGIDLPLGGAQAAASSMTVSDDETTVTRTILPRGVRIITQHVPATRSAAIGLCVPVGSRDESPVHAGATHFLEHLLFKGTPTMSALDIAVAFDAVGGETNAETDKEHTQYYARVRDADVDMALSVLTDMVTSSSLVPDAFDVEKGVILDELAMAKDSPLDAVHEAFAAAVFGDTTLGKPVGGTPEAIRAVSRDDVWEHYQSHYGPDRLIVSVAGNVEHDHIVDLVAASLDRAGWRGDEGGLGPAPRRDTTPAQLAQPTVQERHRDVEQAHVIVGCPALQVGDDRIPAMSVLLSILGGSMSSRLFQEIREKRGLAYTTYAFNMRYSNAGAFGMYAGTSPAHVEQVEQLMNEQLQALASDGPTEEEIVRVRGHVRGAIALGLEDNLSRMGRLSNAELTGTYFTVDQGLARINAVTQEDVRALAAELVNAEQGRAVVLPNVRS